MGYVILISIFFPFTINLNANGQVYTFECNDYDQTFVELCN